MSSGTGNATCPLTQLEVHFSPLDHTDPSDPHCAGRILVPSMAPALAAPSVPVASRLPVPSPRLRPASNSSASNQSLSALTAPAKPPVVSQKIKETLHGPTPTTLGTHRAPTTRQVSRIPAPRNTRTADPGARAGPVSLKTVWGSVPPVQVRLSENDHQLRAQSRAPSISCAILE